MSDPDFKARLGRKPNKPDDRDWTPEKLHRKLGTKHAVPPDSTLDLTLREAIDEGNPFFTTWKGLLALWAFIKSLLKPAPAPIPVPTTDGPLWVDPTVLDQGDFGTCVGNAWAGWGNAEPIRDDYDEDDARAIYYESTCIGGACDPTYQEGSTTRDGAKAMQKRLKLTAYAFATGLADIDEWLNKHGPVVIGINWTDSMFTPDPDGTVHYTGSVEGGHEIVILQNVVSKDRYLVRNSWGSGWGVNGDFFILKTDMQKLLADSGDACLAAEI
jgi:hypothetical protein